MSFSALTEKTRWNELDAEMTCSASSRTTSGWRIVAMMLSNTRGCLDLAFSSLYLGNARKCYD